MTVCFAILTFVEPSISLAAYTEAYGHLCALAPSHLIRV